MNLVRGDDRAAHLEAAADSFEAALLTFDPYDNRIHYFNDAAVRMIGFNRFDLAHKKPSSLFPGQISEVTGFTLECLSTGKAWSRDFGLAQASGETLPVELFASTFPVDGRLFILLVCFDLRALDMRRIEADVNRFYRTGAPQGDRYDSVFRKLEYGNQLILDAAGEGIYGVDAKGATTFLNRAAEQMLGWRSEELIGRSAHTYMHHSHADGSEYPIRACPIYAAFRDGEVHRVDHEVFWRKDGSCFPVEYTSTPIKDKGRLLGAVVVFRDISAKQEAQAELLRALAEVEALRKRLELENAYLQDELRGDIDHKEIVGDSEAIRNILRQIELVAPSDASVLITGESGTGKELIARAIHASSPRSSRPLIRVNCAGIPRELFESEFFGHARGAFTGAVRERVGRFELADGGTIFLDEVGELPLEHQAKLLRILQEKQFERVGGTTLLETDVRVIAATHRDLGRRVREGRFREDLWYRLNVFPITLPPLRLRREDIPALIRYFMERKAREMNLGRVPDVDPEVVSRLQRYDWPGNVRELLNLVERALILSRGGAPVFPDLTPAPDATGAASPTAAAIADPEVRTLDAAMARHIREALRLSNGRIAGPNGASQRLGVHPNTLRSKMQKLGIRPQDF